MPFPTALPSYPDTQGNETLATAGGGVGLSGILDLYGVDLTAIATKLGSGASTPTAGKVLRASGTGTSVWGAVDLTTDITGTLPVANGGTGVTGSTGSGSVVLSTGATIVNPTLTVDTISEHTSGNGVTIDGLSLKDGKLNTTDSVVTSNITNGNVTAIKLDTNAIGHGFLEIGRTTLGSAGDTITVSGLPVYRYLKIFVSAIDTGGTINGLLTFNNDTGANYSRRYSSNGAADTTTTGQNSLLAHSVTSASPHFAEITVYNVASDEKTVVFFAGDAGTAGAANAPGRVEGVGKWANTSNSITRVDITNGGTGDFAIGSEVVVLGKN
jgi:hypothetical protein